jgi:hypothetical protein
MTQILQENKKVPYSKREWITFLILLMIVEAFIFCAAFVYAPNGSALSYISFAATLISIILAVLAIGYTYGESIKDKGKSDALEEQIKELKLINEKIKIQANTLNKLEDIYSSIDSLKKKVDEGNSHVGGLISNILNNSLNEKINKNYSISQVNKNEIALGFFRSPNNILVISALTLICFYKIHNENINKEILGVNLYEFIFDYFDSLRSDKALQKNILDDHLDCIILGGTFNLITNLISFGLVDENYSIDNAFISLLFDIVKKYRTTDEPYNSIIAFLAEKLDL